MSISSMSVESQEVHLTDVTMPDDEFMDSIHDLERNHPELVQCNSKSDAEMNVDGYENEKKDKEEVESTQRIEDDQKSESDEDIVYPKNNPKRRRFKVIYSQSDEEDSVNNDSVSLNKAELSIGSPVSPSTVSRESDRDISDMSSDTESAEYTGTSGNESYSYNDEDSGCSSSSRLRSPKPGHSVLALAIDYRNTDHHLEEIKNDTIKPRRKFRNANKTRKPRTTKIDYESHQYVNDESTSEAQEVSIHKIDLRKFDSKSNEQAIIKKIITKYNDNLQNITPKYKENNVTVIPEIREDDKSYFIGSKFQNSIYTQNVPRTIGLLSAFGLTKKSCVIHAIIFYHRFNEIFALTTGQAWNVVQWCSDFDFPAQIAARILSEKGEIETTSKSLVGNEATNKKTMKKHQENNPFSLLELCTSFMAEFRDKSSILRFVAFSGQRNTKMIKALGSVRIKKRLDTSDFIIILDHFSKISRRMPTFEFDPSSQGQEQIREEDTSAHLKYLTPVSNELKKSLDIELLGYIIQAAQNNTPANLQKLQNFSISHKYYQDFSNASKYYLHYKRNIKETYDEIPTLEQIVQDIPYGSILESIERRRTSQIRNVTIGELIEEFEKTIRFSFKVAEEAKTPEKLLNFIEGPLWYEEDQRVYWHVMSLWCSVRNDYLLIVHDQFLRILKKGIMKLDNEAFLERPWDENEMPNSQSYISIYGAIHGFFIWNHDSAEVKLFDMMYLNEKNEIYIYYVAQGLNYKSLNTGGRITSSSLSIQNACIQESSSGSSKPSAAIDRFYNENTNIQLKFGNQKAFRDALSKAKIVYAIGQEDPRIYEESELNTQVKIEDILKILEAEERDHNISTATRIHQALIDGQYLESTNSITSKFLIASFQKFNLGLVDPVIGSISETNLFVFNKIVQAFKSKYNNFLLKLDFWRIRRDLPLRSKFLICPIPVPQEKQSPNPKCKRLPPTPKRKGIHPSSSP